MVQLLFSLFSKCGNFFSDMLGLIVNTMRSVKRKGGKNPALWWKCQEIALMLAPPESSHPSKWYTKHRCCLNWFEWTILLSVAGILTDKYYVLYSFFLDFSEGWRSIWVDFGQDIVTLTGRVRDGNLSLTRGPSSSLDERLKCRHRIMRELSAYPWKEWGVQSWYLLEALE